MKSAGCLECHQKVIGNDWINIKKPQFSRILRAPLAKRGGSLGLNWCRNRKAPKPDFTLVGQRHQPPDVFQPHIKPVPNTNGQVVTPFADQNNHHYKAILAIIQQARIEALKTPRVDMPGADIIKGKYRRLPALTPPKYVKHNKNTL